MGGASVLRYAPTLPLPALPFVPGCGMPRPVLLPAFLPGNAAPESVLAVAWFRYGVDLFNHGFWWEAHECWETPWRAAARGSARRLLLQGLILWAAGHLQWSVGRAQGAEWHLGRAVARLREGLSQAGPLAAAGELGGLDIAARLPGWQTWSAPPLARWNREQLLARLPCLELPATPGCSWRNAP